MESSDKALQGKYPAKAHFKRVVSWLEKNSSQASESGTISRGIVFIEATKSKLWPNSDQEQPFRQSRHFYYLSGCELPNATIVYDLATSKSVLFIDAIDPDDVVWSGLPMSPEEALKKYDVDETQTADKLDNYIRQQSFVKQYCWCIQEPEGNAALQYFDNFRTDIKLAIEECRVVKDEYEIALVRRANEVSAIAHKAVFRAAKTATNENILAGAFINACMSNGCPNQAYSSIVASGTDAATLHYVRNNKAINKGTLNLLLDAAPEQDCYAADVTRTFPLTGKFTPESAAIYTIVLKMQNECMAKLKGGVKWDDVHQLAHEIAIDGLLRIGILKGDPSEILAARTSCAFFPHGLGHYLGMDTHDTGGHANYDDEDKMFKYLRVRGNVPAGAIITVEPGVYFCKFIIDPYLKDEKQAKYIDEQVLERYWAVGGVRIEDDVLITEDGMVNLTDVPREMEEIEAIVAQG